MTPSPRREFVRVASCLLIFGIYVWIRKKYRVLSGVGCYPTLLEIQARIRENVLDFVGFCWVLSGIVGCLPNLRLQAQVRENVSGFGGLPADFGDLSAGSGKHVGCCRV